MGKMIASEAAWQAAERGVPVVLYEMRSHTRTPVHKTDQCAELVCSNSLGNNLPHSAPFLLKEELRKFNSIVISSADRHCVPAGGALAVDRDLFSQEMGSRLVETSLRKSATSSRTLVACPAGLVTAAI